ncbi:uncharacterized protein LOC143230756 isoform X2 [Tachypleus tridentatus]|uniref:uncharacterized protein LOC143230756 isoform X2 n=1 Tax=Tachypleus tridentatus TaxID=6853 RepID=UPI003FD62C1A
MTARGCCISKDRESLENSLEREVLDSTPIPVNKHTNKPYYCRKPFISTATLVISLR